MDNTPENPNQSRVDIAPEFERDFITFINMYEAAVNGREVDYNTISKKVGKDIRNGEYN